MTQSFAVWILIVLSLLTANLPFVLERPFLVLPWSQKGEPVASAWMQWVLSLLFFCLLGGLAYFGFTLISTAFVAAADMLSVSLFVVKVLGMALAVGLLLTYPGWRARGHVVQKSFFARLLEVLVFYALIGLLGFAFEINIGNSFPQKWEFYAITLSLFLVLGYPGFVYRYLLKRRKR